MGFWTKALAGIAATTLLTGGSAAIAREKQANPPAEEGAEDAPHAVPLEPILVQGFVKKVDDKQITLTAPGAPADLPLALDPETRYISGEEDVSRAEVQAGQLVRAALLPLGDELVALVVEVVPEEPTAPDEVPRGEPPADEGTPAPMVPPHADGPDAGDNPVQEL